MKQARRYMLALAMAAALPLQASGQAIRDGFDATTLAGNDDLSTGLVDFGFTVDFFGVVTSQLYINNNGNITFDGPLSTFTPFALSSTERQIIAPFFADVDTRTGNPVTYGDGSVGGFNAFAVNWLGVGYYSDRQTSPNYFQLVMIDRSDTGLGNFDFEFNYGSIVWDTGEASGGGPDGLCMTVDCAPARVGWSNGSTDTYELFGSGMAGAFLDGGAQALNGQRLVFQVREGDVLPPNTTVPEPITMVLLGSGLVGIAGAARKRRREGEIESEDA